MLIKVGEPGIHHAGDFLSFSTSFVTEFQKMRHQVQTDRAE